MTIDLTYGIDHEYRKSICQIYCHFSALIICKLNITSKIVATLQHMGGQITVWPHIDGHEFQGYVYYTGLSILEYFWVCVVDFAELPWNSQYSQRRISKRTMSGLTSGQNPQKFMFTKTILWHIYHCVETTTDCIKIKFYSCYFCDANCMFGDKRKCHKDRQNSFMNLTCRNLDYCHVNLPERTTGFYDSG